MKRWLGFFLCFGTFNLLAQFALTQDINTDGNGSSVPQRFFVDGSVMYFRATDAVNGSELWITDGTFSGTRLLKDINPGIDGSVPAEFAKVGELVYFSAADQEGRELWRTDGTAAGTLKVKDINPGDASSTPRFLIDFEGKLYFSATNGIDDNGIELWTSDGTTDGTMMLKDINPSFESGSPQFLTVLGNHFYFSANDGSDTELWQSDGTAPGTVEIHDINPSGSSNPSSLLANNGLLFFTATNGADGTEPHVTDGTTLIQLKNIRAGSTGSGASGYTALGDDVFFSANNGFGGGETGNELYVSNGTVAGTELVADINMGTGSSLPNFMTAVGTNLFFAASNGSAGIEMWVYNGSSVAQVPDINAGSGSSQPSDLVAFNNRVFFTADDGGGIAQLWSADASSPLRASTVEVVNDLSITADMVVFNGRLWFVGDDAKGSELWNTDGTTTALFKDLNPGNNSTAIDNVTAIGNEVLFSADANNLWISDGTSGGTNKIIGSDDVNFSGAINDLLPFGEQVLFAAGGSTLENVELWAYNIPGGTTSLVKDINTGAGENGSIPQFLSDINGTVYFSARTEDEGREVWKTDGTSGNTVRVTDINPSTGQADPANFTRLNATEFLFSANDGTNGTELWKSNGTTASLVKNINTVAAQGSSPTDLVNLNGTVYFAANDGANGRELWRTDGTTDGTMMDTELNAGPGSSSPELLTLDATNDRIFFVANDGTVGDKLFVLGDEDYLESFDDIQEMVVVDGMLYFTADDGVNGLELWISDGTESGTQVLRDFRGELGGEPFDLKIFTADGNDIVFGVNDGLNGKQLYVSNGTLAGTVRLALFGGQIEQVFAVTGSKVFFLGATAAEGNELWSYTYQPNQPPTVENALPDRTLSTGFGTEEISLEEVFTDPEGDALNYVLANSDDGVATVSLNGELIVITEVGVGSTTVTVNVDDGKDGAASDAFVLTISDTPNQVPFVANEAPDQTYFQDFGIRTLDISDVFTDPDGDPLTYTVISSNGSIATAAISGGDAIEFAGGAALGETTITLTANDGRGGEASDTFTLTVTDTDDTDDGDGDPNTTLSAGDLDAEWSFYPNPAQQLLRVEGPFVDREVVQVQWVALNGGIQLMEVSANAGSVLLDVRSLESGVYVLNLTHGGQVLSRTIVKD